MTTPDNPYMKVEDIKTDSSNDGTNGGSSEYKVANMWIIDDDPMASFYIKRLAELGELASIITIYDKAQWAIDYLLHHKKSVQHLPDVILLDIYMPELDGWGFLQEFQNIKAQLTKSIDIFIISSSGHPKDKNRAQAIPEVKAYLQKPLTKDQLREQIIKYKSR
jgi:response regulator of citrate/malate metabolism